MRNTLKLIALDTDDLTILAAHLQDAVGTIGDMTFQKAERRFVALLNRYSLTSDERVQAAHGERRRAALRIERVTGAQVQGVDLTAKGEVLCILTAVFEPDSDPAKAPAGALMLILAGGGAIRLHVECIEIGLEDLGPAWAARAEPKHRIDDGDGHA
jgi:hypothetical protein